MNTTLTNLKRFLMMFAATMVLLGAAPSLQAANRTNSVSGNWSSTTTWSGSVVPVAGDAVFILSGFNVTNDAAQACASIVINGSGTLTVNNNLTLTSTLTVGTSGGTGAALTVASGGTLTGVTTLNFAGTTPSAQNNGALSLSTFGSGGTLTQGANANLTITQSNGNVPGGTLVATASGNTVTYSGSGPAVKVTTYQNLTFTFAGSSSYSWNSSIVVNGTLTAGGTSGNALNNVQGTFGAVVESGGNITCNGAIAVSGNLTVTSGTLYAQSGLLTVTGTTTINGGTLELGSSGGGGAFTGDVTISSGTFNSSANNSPASFAGNLTVSGGTFTAGTGTHTFSGTGKTVTGSVSIPNVAVTGAITNAGTLTVTTALTGSGTLTQNANSTLNIGGTSTITALTATANPNTVNYTKNNPQTVLATTYDSLTIGGGSSSVKTLGGATTVNTTLTIAASTTLSIGANTLTFNGGITSSGTLTGGATSSISFGGSTASVTLPAVTLQNLTVNNANGLALGGNTTIGGTLTLTSGLLAVGANTLTLNGPTIAGTPDNLTTTSSSSLSFGGSSASVNVPTSVTTLNNLTINNVNGVTLNSSLTVGGILTLTSGKIATGANTLTVPATASISGGSSSSYVNGILDRGLTTSSTSAAFPVGDSTVYAPVSLASVTATHNGDLIVSTVANQNSQGAFSSSGLSQSKYVNRDWTITAANNYAQSAGNVTLNFVAGDVQGSMSTSTDIVGKYSGGTWTHPTVASRTATNITVSGITSFSDWVIAELPTPTFSVSSKTVAYGTTSVTLTGTLNASSPTIYPVNGSTVTASINGHAVSGTVTDGAGDFTINYNDASLATDGVVGSPFNIKYVFAGDANLAAATNNSTALTVSPKVASVTADAKTKTYGDVNPLLTAVTNGAVNGDVINVTLTTDATQFSSVGTSNIFVLAGSNPNYSVTTTGATLTIGPKAASVAADAKTKTYGEVNPMLTAVTNGAVNGDVINVTLTTDATQFSAVGVSNITVTAGSNPNYNVTTTDGTLTINAATLTFSGLSSMTNSYGVTNITLTGTLSASGPVYPASGETVSATIQGFTVNGTVTDDTGDFSITYNDPSLATNDVAGSPDTITYNYGGNANLAAAADTSTSLTITNVPLSITANDDSKCYGDIRSYGSGSTAFTSSGLVNGETIGTVTITASDSPSGTGATDPAGTYNLTPSAAADGTFDANNYLITYNNGILTVNPLPTTSGITGPNSVEPLSTATYSVVNTAGSTYDWTVPSDATFTGGTGSSINVTFGSTSGSVSVTETSSSGCIGTPQNLYVTVNSCTAPTIVGGIDPGSTTLCAGSPLVLTLTNVAGAAPLVYQWQTNGVDILDATNASYTNLSVTLADMTNYVCIVSNSCGSVTSLVATVTVNSLPTVSVNSTTICAGDSATLTATTSASSPSYQWNDPANSTTASITVSPSSTTSYTVTVTDGTTGCADSGSGTVTVNPMPAVSVNSETLCAGGSATLTATTSANTPSYLWNDPANSTTASITVSPSSTMTYTVTVTDGMTGCVNSGSGTVTVNPLPAVSVNSPTICSGDSATLTATTSANTPSYLWNDPANSTTASITVSPTSTTTYTVTVTDGVTGCVNSGSGTITVNSATANDVTYNATIGYKFNVAETNLLGHASGTGGVTLTTVQSPSANGVTVTNSGGQIFYLANVTNTDTFTYTVASVTGGCTATGTVTLNPIHPIGSAKIGIPTNGMVTIQFFGIPGTNYVVETATNIIFTPYWPLSTNTAGSDGSWQFTDTHATNQQQYYRSTWQP